MAKGNAVRLEGDAARFGIWTPADEMRDLLRALLDLAPPSPAAVALLHRGLAPGAEAGLKRLMPLALSKPWAATLDPASQVLAATAKRAATVRALAYQHFASRAIARLNAEGIEPLVLKGYPLAQLFYDDPAHRPASDLDVLFHPDDVARARACFADQGFRSADDAPDPQLTHAFCLRHEQEQFEIDLHWNALYCSRWPHADDGFWSRAVRLDTPAGRAVTLSPADHLIHACLHGRRMNRLSPFRWIVDAGQIMLRRGEEIDWTLVTQVAVEHRYPQPLAGCLRYLREVIGLPVPAEVVDRLDAAPMSATDKAFFRLETSDSRPSGLLHKASTLVMQYRRQTQAPYGQGSGFLTWLRLRWRVETIAGLPGELRRRLRHRPEQR